MVKTDAIKLLAIDDKLDNLTTLRAVVQDALPQTLILTATNGPAGIELAAAEDPDVILLDIVMPGMDGFEVCRRLKADERLQDIPVVFLTALKTDVASRVKALEVGGDGFLAKPLETAELTAQIRAMNKVKMTNRTQRTEKKRLENLVVERTADLREIESSYQAMFANMASASCVDEIVYKDGRAVDYRILDVNPAFERITGIRRQEAAGALASALYGLGYAPFLDIYCRVAETGEPAEFEAWFEPIKKHLHITAGCPKPGFFSTVFTDITYRKQAETYREMGLDILRMLDEQGDLQESIQLVIATLKARTGLDAVGLRLQEGDDFPYIVQDGFSRDFLLTENTLVERGRDGGVCMDKNGNICLECTCGLVISGKTDPANPLFTKAGSFWINDSFPLLDLPSDQDPRLHPRNNCIHQGYASVALIAVRNRDRIVGLIQLNDKRKGRFTLETIEILESIAAHIGSALIRKQIEADMQQSRAAALNIMEDAIAERDRAEKAVADLEESKALMEAIVENAPLMIYLKAATDLRFVLFNRAGEEITGHDRKEVLGKTDEAFFTPEETAHFMDGELEVLEGKTEMLDETAIEPLITISKGARWLHTRKVCIRGNDGKAKYILGVAEDVTERKLAAEALKNTNMELQQAMQDLQKAQKQIIQQERLSALGQMASGIAHDFNNILMPIIGCSELLISTPNALDDREEAIHMLEMIHSAGEDARQIVRRLRTVYKVNYGSEYDIVDLSNIVESALSITMAKWKEEMRAKGALIEIVTDFQPAPHINGNAAELREVMTNLIFNATDAMPKGGIIKFRLHSVKNTAVVLEVSDTGYGMDEATLDQCMEPFFSTKGPQGSGLGLAMVHGIVERHGGTINIESKPGTGTTVRMRFPVPVETKATQLAPEKESAPLSPMRVLIVDDEERAIKLLIRILKTDNHQVETADNGRQGLDTLRKGQFDMIITDRAMPVMGGDEFAVEAQKIQPGIPIIMLTGFGEIMKDSGDLPPGVSRVMSKPLSRKDLRSVMSSVMRNQGV